MLNAIILMLALSADSTDKNEYWVAGISKGDSDVFKDFFECNSPGLLHFLKKKSLSPDVSKDILQQAFLIIWENRNQLKIDKSLKAYLFRIAYTRMLNHFRDTKKFNDDPFNPDALEASNKSTQENNELKQAIENAIQNMPEKRKIVFQLCFQKGFSYKETSEILGVSLKTIENHMALAFKDLRIELKHFI